MSTRSRRLATALQTDRLHVFVPAVMSVGLVFWVVSELRMVVRERAEEARRAQAAIAGAEVAALTLGRAGDDRPPPQRGLRPRPVYLLLAMGLLGGALYAVATTAANFVRDESPAADFVWIPALACVVAGVASVFGLAALTTFLRWPTPPPLARGVLLRSPLRTAPVPEGASVERPSWHLTLAFAVTAAMAAMLAVVVAWSPPALDALDTDVARWLHDRDPLGALTVLDPIGRTQFAMMLAGLAGLASMRCRVLATAHITSVGIALLISLAVRPLVGRTRPPVGVLAGGVDSFPSGHVMLATIFAGLLPLALAVLLERRWIIRPLRVAMAVGVLASATHRAAVGSHWPTDVLGGALIGLTLVLASQLSIDTARSHRTCHHCLWSDDPHRSPVLGAVHLSMPAARLARIAGHLTAAGAAMSLAFLTLTRSVPTAPDGFGFGAAIAVPAQLGLAALVSIGALIAWRWDAAGAALIALAATGLGIFASVQYRPAVGIAMTASLMVPAVLLWLGWQHRRRPHEIVILAVVTTALLGGTWSGASYVYDSFFGPTHPVSDTAGVAVDGVEWVWTGGLQATRLTVVARLADDGERARVVATAEDGSDVTSPAVDAGNHQIARLALDGLAPDTDYTFDVEVDGQLDHGRGRGRFHTPADGPMSFRVALASCARVDSNGAVYDAIRASDPLFYLALGDIHYGNIPDPSPEAFLGGFDRLLTTPAQSALYRQVPIAYVWDDHDYGANDADATSPTRSAARLAYRAAVPHYPVAEGDAPIYQAFTVGRVRFVLTDGRSERTEDTLLGEAQLAWLLDELRTASRTHAVVVWGNSVPWIEEPVVGADGWGGYPGERRTIADAIADAGIDNLVMVSGDAHMVALDDGTNSDYATDGGAGFPVLHAAALDRPGHVKGGPYSGGAFPGSGQFGLLDITDDGGSTVTVRMSGHTWDDRQLVELTRTFDVPIGR